MATDMREGIARPREEGFSGVRVAARRDQALRAKPPTRWVLLPRALDLPTQVAFALLVVVAATLARLGLGLINPRIVSFSLYFPAVLLAALVGGWRSGLTATVMSAALAWGLFVGPRAGVSSPVWVSLVNLSLNTGIAAAMVLVAGHIGTLVERLGRSQKALAERNLYYDTLFHTMSEGFALCEAIRDDQGRLTDYVVLEINPALQRMLGVGPEATGGKLSDVPVDMSGWLARCARVLETGASEVLEYHNPATGLWHEIHVNRVTSERMAQLFFDITERKVAQARQAALFDELNHRVKNNLSIVSAILRMQARGADPPVRAELLKAVDRVQSIADVHASLYQGHGSEDVDFGAYLESLCERLSGSLLQDDRIRIVPEARPALLAVDRAVALGMVVNELVTNAVKYAYPAPAEGEISVRFGPTAEGPVLSVGDRGLGLPEDFETRLGGLGMRLIRSLVQQVGGVLDIRRQPGATFEIRLRDGVRLD
jgi:two-component sensor histidine kinase/PAS domain-containing protein